MISEQCDGNSPLFVSITTIYPNKHHDGACILSAGDHPFLKHPSYVAYRHIEQRSEVHIQRMIDNGEYIAREDFKPEVLERILEGACQSDEIKPFAKKIILEQNA
ncbi:MAG: hypothetical protein AAGG79_01260 [Pseudomonadota bacterium]